ncbi:MAG: hypothetical protein ABH875_02350 [Candidatus Omnitrophota bacterium]
MKILLTCLAVLWIIIGALLVVLTDAMRQICRNFLNKKNLNLRVLAVISFVVGALLILGSSEVNKPWVLILLGLMGIAKGLFFTFAPKKTVMDFIHWWLNAPNKMLRIWGVFAFCIGIVFLLIL